MIFTLCFSVWRKKNLSPYFSFFFLSRNALKITKQNLYFLEIDLTKIIIRKVRSRNCSFFISLNIFQPYLLILLLMRVIWYVWQLWFITVFWGLMDNNKSFMLIKDYWRVPFHPMSILDLQKKKISIFFLFFQVSNANVLNPFGFLCLIYLKVLAKLWSC